MADYIFYRRYCNLECFGEVDGISGGINRVYNRLNVPSLNLAFLQLEAAARETTQGCAMYNPQTTFCKIAQFLPP